MGRKVAAPLPQFRARRSRAGTSIGCRRWPTGCTVTEVLVRSNRPSNGRLGAILGALIAVAVAVFLLNGGEHVGKTTVHGDDDLPPIAQGQPK
jgi:hypothetical protein